MAKEAKMSQANYEAIRDHIFDRVHRTGEEIKNDFPNCLRAAIEAKAWKHFKDAEGKPFPNLVEWLMYPWPHGPGLGAGKNAISYEDAMKLTEGHPAVHRVLAKSVPTRLRGRPKKGVATHFKTVNSRSKSVTTLTLRLEKEKPEFYRRYLRGEFGSVTEAAKAAGLIKGTSNLSRTKSAYRKMSAKERDEFIKWLRTKEAKELASKAK